MLYFYRLFLGLLRDLNLLVIATLLCGLLGDLDAQQVLLQVGLLLLFILLFLLLRFRTQQLSNLRGVLQLLLLLGHFGLLLQAVELHHCAFDLGIGVVVHLRAAA